MIKMNLISNIIIVNNWLLVTWWKLRQCSPGRVLGAELRPWGHLIMASHFHYFLQ